MTDHLYIIPPNAVTASPIHWSFYEVDPEVFDHAYADALKRPHRWWNYSFVWVAHVNGRSIPYTTIIPSPTTVATN